MSDVMPASDLLPNEDMTVASALQRLFTISENHNQLAVGATEVAKVLYRMSSQDETQNLKLVVLAKDLVQDFQTVITAKCKEFGIPVIYLEDRMELGSITPIKKIKKTGAIGIKDFICETREKAFIVNAIKQ